MTAGKTIALTRKTFVDEVMSLLFNMLSRLVIAFLPRSKSLNFMAAVTICSDSGAPQNKVSHCFHCFPIYLPWSDGTRGHDLRFLNVVLSQLFHFPLSLPSRGSLVHLCFLPVSLIAQWVKNPSAMQELQEMWIQSLLGRSPGEGNGNPLQYFCLGNPTDREDLWATVHEVAKSWTRLNTQAH